ncbi:MAG: hypothetical protein EOO74_05640 [Myxococcales bacterium]|nr:MAG: hypothetical protein EOO74_05640 [Myxococcales bacterium]
MAARAFVASAFVGSLTLAGAAFADTPEAWADAPDHSGLDYLLVLVLIPLGIALVVSLLSVLPSLIKGEKYEPGDNWRGESEWFGGPRQGIEARDHADVGSDKGGASGNW